MPRHSTGYIALLAIAFLVAGCGLFGGDFDQNVDCSGECDNDAMVCTDETVSNFDYDDYDRECDDTGADFCIAGDSDDCVEPDFEIEEATIADVHAALEAREISCEWLTRRTLDRILWHDLYMDDESPPINAFVHLNDRAMEAARTLDDYQRCEGELAGPLHCIGFGIKTNIASEDLPVTHGSLALEDPQPRSDAFVVERLREAGGVNIGSTTMDEFAAGAQGLSGRSGKTGNPYDTYHSSGGSSAGSGAAVGANLLMGALGTDNCSSLTIPASYNGLVTIRSSHQLLSTDGIFPTNRLDAVVGPMTRTVEDMALFFDEMAAFNPHYGPHCRQGIEHDERYADYLDEDGLDGKRIGVLEQVGDDPDDERRPYDDADAELEDHFQEFFDELTDEGAELVWNIKLDDLSLNRRGTGSGYDANRFLEETDRGVSDYDELCETGMYSRYVFDSKDECTNRAGQSARQLESNLESGLDEYQSRRAYVEGIMDDHDLDALVYPADRRGAARRAYTATMCVVSSVTGLPNIVVPAGQADNGLPIGMSFTARMFDDEQLFELAYAYEQATDHRASPSMPDLEGPPPVDIDDFEQIHHQLGVEAFEEVLRDDEKYDLRPEVFADITREILEHWGLDDELIDD